MQIDIHICAISNGFLVTMPTYGATEDTVAALYEDRGNLSHFFPTFDAVCDGLPALAEKAKADHEAHRAKLAEEHKRWEEDKKRYTDDAKQPGQVQSGGIAGYDHGKVPVSGTIYREPDSDDDNQTLRKLPEEVAAEQIEPIVQPAFTIGAEPVDDPIGDQFDEADRRPA